MFHYNRRRANIELNHLDILSLSSDKTEESGSHSYEEIDNIDQDHTHTTEALVEGPAIPLEDTSTEAAGSEVVFPDAAIMTSSNQAYGCPVDESHTHTNMDQVEAITLSYTTSDRTRTYRPPHAAVSFSLEQPEVISDAAVDVIPSAIEEDTITANPSEVMSPIITSPNQAYGCPTKKMDEGHSSKNVDLATTLFYTISDETRTYKPHELAIEEAAVSFSLEQPEVIADATVDVIPTFIEEEHKTANPSKDTSTITTSPNQAYGCPIKRVNESHTHMNVDLVEATYTTSDGKCTYMPPKPEPEAMAAASSDPVADSTVAPIVFKLPSTTSDGTLV